MNPLPTKPLKLSGWGRIAPMTAACVRPERTTELAALPAGAMVARGMGRSYGDAAVCDQGVVLTTRMNRLLSFDAASGVVNAEAGVTLDELMQIMVPRGWLPPVLPGTRHVTLGGAFASNVHGKNHYAQGDFAEHVLSITLVLADGKRRECTREHHADLFWATAGGMGLTGVIESLRLRLRPITSASVRAVRQRTQTLSEMMALFRQHRDTDEYLVGWIDHSARRGNLGRGIFEAASHTDEGMPLAQYQHPQVRGSVPWVMPSWLLNRWSMALYNRLRFRGVSFFPVASLRSFADFFHPLDAIGHWNRLYGAQGFFQFQCVLPDHPKLAQQMEELLLLIQKRGLFSFLAVLKYHRHSVGMLSFPMEGFSLALDFPNSKKTRMLLGELNRWVADRGGRVYLAKDATLERPEFERMYAHALPEWRQVIAQANPNQRWRSRMSDRLGMQP